MPPDMKMGPEDMKNFEIYPPVPEDKPPEPEEPHQVM